MKIVTRDELAKMPNGTLYCEYDGCYGNFYVITGRKEGSGFNGVMPLSPFEICTGDCDFFVTNWCTIDTTDYDYDKSEKFAVFSKTEIRAMITVLQYALADCNFDINTFMDTYYYKDYEIPEKELDEWLD